MLRFDELLEVSWQKRLREELAAVGYKIKEKV